MRLPMLKIAGILFFLLLTLSVEAQNTSEDSEDIKMPKEPEELSGAEIIIRLQKNIAEDQQRLILLRNRIAQLEPEIEELTQLFNSLDREYKIDSAKTEIVPVQKRWEYVRAFLDLHLRTRQAVQQQFSIIEKKIEKQKEIVDFITIGQIPVTDSMESFIAENDTTAQEDPPVKIEHRKIMKAFEEVDRLETELQVSRHSLLLVEQLMRLNREDLELSRAMAEASNAKWDMYQQKPQILETGLSLNELGSRLNKDTAVISLLEERIARLEKIYTPLVNAVNQAEQKVEVARENLAFQQSPLAPHQILYWVKYHLPRIIIILGVLILLGLAIRWIIGIILTRLKKRRIAEERRERIETLKLASSSMITILIFVIGLLVVLSEIGIDITVVLGGAAVLSLAIAFGAQSLIKDYFSGFMILLENQYRVGNVVKINNISGVVENMSLRLTMLRDIEGVAHFIPHGQITEVSNMTHGWAQIAVDIRISYDENVDRVISILSDLLLQMKDDPEFGPLITGDPEMLGVDKFTETAIIIKFLIKTRPMKQWSVKRELLRRIKNRFDDLGIKLPTPYLTVHNTANGRREDKETNIRNH